MTATRQSQRPSALRQLLSLTTLWYILTSPEMFSAALLAMAVVAGLSLIIPQQNAQIVSPGDFVIWVSNLPPLFQQVFQPMQTLGLFQIYRSVWFWLPTAWLTLVSLIILADYAPATWQRLKPNKESSATLTPYPLSHVSHKTIRLTAPKDASEATSADAALSELEANLSAAGYKLAAANNTTHVTANRHPLRWAGPLLLIIGTLIIILGIILQALWGQSESVLLSVSSQTQTSFMGETIQINTFQPIPDQYGNLIAGDLNLNIGEAQNLAWSLYHPYQLNGWWVIPTKVQSVADITFNQQTTTEKSSLIFDDVSKPILFARSPENLTFELQYIAQYGGPTYRLNVIEAANTAPPPLKINQEKDTFSISGLNLSGQVIIKDNILIHAFKLPGLTAWIIGGILFALGLIHFLLKSPAIARLDVTSKGRGSKINIEVESLGDTPVLSYTINNTLQLTSQEEQDA